MTPAARTKRMLGALRSLEEQGARQGGPLRGVAADLTRKLRAKLFPEQLAFIDDPATRKGEFVGRRAGKTTGVAVWLLLGAIACPGAASTYFGLTAGSAEDTMAPVLVDRGGLVDEFGIGHRYNRVQRYLTLDNGSIIELAGLDVSYKEIDKVLGSRKYRIAIDECQSQTQDLEKIITKKAQACVSDYLDRGGGQIALLGTAGDFLGEHYWYRVTTGQVPGWSIHRWSHDANPAMQRAKSLEQANFLEQYGPAYVETNWWRQQYLCEWILENASRVYQYTDARNVLREGDPRLAALRGALKGYTTALGVDLGYDDDCAFVVVAWSKHDPALYVLHAEKAPAMNLDALAGKLRELATRYRCTYFPIDTAGSGKIIVEDFRRRYNFPFEVPKSKTDKLEFIRQMNSDYTTGRIFIVEPTCRELLLEYSTLLWDAKAVEAGKRREDPRAPNHLADAALYAFSTARHYWGRVPEPRRAETNDETAARAVREMLKRRERREAEA